MELTLLTVPACPNAAIFEERLAAALADRPGVVVWRREVTDEREAAEAGMCGSPTLLVNGMARLAHRVRHQGLSCRLFRDATGRHVGAPPVEALRRTLEQAGAHDQPRC